MPFLDFPPVPQPSNDFASIREATLRIKEAVELLTGQRGATSDHSLGNLVFEIESAGSRVYELERITPDLVEKVEGVETRANDISASGQLVMGAGVTSTGYEAFVNVYLRADTDSVPGTDRQAGMYFTLNGTVASVAFDVDQFMLRDSTSGTTEQVFIYSAGQFTFNSNVTINASLLVNGTVTALKYGDLSVDTTVFTSAALSTMFLSTMVGASATGVDASSAWTTVDSLAVTGAAEYSGVLHILFSGTYSLTGSGGLYTPQWRVIDNLGNVYFEAATGGGFGFNGFYTENFYVRYFPVLTTRTFSLQIRTRRDGGSTGTSETVTVAAGGRMDCCVYKR